MVKGFFLSDFNGVGVGNLLVHMRIDLTLKLLDIGVSRIAWQYPETHLHPSAQLHLTDILRQMMPELGVGVIRDKIQRHKEAINAEKDGGKMIRMKMESIQLQKELDEAIEKHKKRAAQIEINRKRYLEQLKAKEK